MGRGTVSNSFTGFWGPIPHTGLPGPVLTHGEVLLHSVSVHVLLIVMRHLSFPEQKWRRNVLVSEK